MKDSQRKAMFAKKATDYKGNVIEKNKIYGTGNPKCKFCGSDETHDENCQNCGRSDVLPKHTNEYWKKRGL